MVGVVSKVVGSVGGTVSIINGPRCTVLVQFPALSQVLKLKYQMPSERVVDA